MLHPKQARYQASLQPDSVSILAQRVARALPLPGTTSGRRHNALALPSRYQAHINLLKTFDKLARDRSLVGVRLAWLPPRYLPTLLVLGGREVPSYLNIRHRKVAGQKPAAWLQDARSAEVDGQTTPKSAI